MMEEDKVLDSYPQIIAEAERLELGVVLYMPHRKAMLGQKQIVNIWIKSRAPQWNLSVVKDNPNLSLLLAYKLKKNWNCFTRILMVVDNEEEKPTRSGIY